MLIKTENLSKVYGGGENKVTALHRANLEIAAGDFISIMGPSGSGKSTLLHLLSGLDFPTEGTLYYDGQDIYKFSDKDIVNTVYTNIHTRVTEIGTQRAIGMSVGSLYKTFLWEGTYYGVFAAVTGSAAGYLCTVCVESAGAGAIQLTAPPLQAMVEAALLSIAACLLATAIPLRRIAKSELRHQ